MNPFRSRRAPGTREEGVVLPMVVGTMMILTALMLTSLALVLNNMAPSRSDQDSKAALAAAQAGIDEYISRLSANSEYWANDGVDATNPAFTAAGIGVPGTGGTAARFAYRVRTSAATTAQQGFITLEVTGRSRPSATGREVSRTLTARLEPRGFLDFVYFTNYEAIDPSLYNASLVTQCSAYWYPGVGPGFNRPDNPCRRIQWATGDIVDGPLHSNDALLVEGSVLFMNPRTESSWPKTVEPAKLWRGSGTPSSGTTAVPGYLPRFAPVIDLPAGNKQMTKYVQPKTDSFVPPDTATDRPGCLYTGATRITFVGNQMKVLSPNTNDSNTPARCLNRANRAVEQTLAIPPVIHVAPTSGSCTGVGFPFKDVSNPALNEDVSGTTTDYTCTRGTAFVQGVVDGQVTVSAEDDVVVTADLTVADGGSATDVVGLVAGNYVWVYHPVTAAGANLLPYAQAVRNIEAAILSLRHSFVVQNWDKGALLSTTGPTSKLRVFGSISQKFRGAVGTPSSGYLKNYVYDRRFQVLQPPYFITPEDAPWEAVRITDG